MTSGGFDERLRAARRTLRRRPYADAALLAVLAGVCLALAAGIIR